MANPITKALAHAPARDGAETLTRTGTTMAGTLKSSVKAAKSQATTTVITRSDFSRIAKLEPAEIAELEQTCRKLLDPDFVDGPIKLIASGDRAMRKAGFEALERAMANALRKGGADASGDAIARAVEKIGLGALILDPHFAYRWRQHIAAMERQGRAALSFADFVADPRNKDLLTRIARRIGLEELQRWVPEVAKGVISRRAWKAKSNSAQRDEVIRKLAAAHEAMGDEAFFKLVFNKVHHLIPEGQEEAIKKAIRDRLKSGKAADPTRPDGLDKMFKDVDPGHMQGGLGEALSAHKMMDVAQAKADELGKPVFLMLGNQTTATRNVGARKIPKGQTSAAATERTLSSEAADAWVVTASKDKQLSDRVVGETKTSARPGTQVLEQIDHSRESIEVVQSRTVEVVMRMEKGKTPEILTLKQAKKDLGGTIEPVGTKNPRDALVLANKDGHADAVLAAQKAHEDAGGIGAGADELALIASGKFIRTKQAPHVAYAGKQQVANLETPLTDPRKLIKSEADRRGVAFADYGAEYEAVRDVAMDILSDTKMTR